MEQRGCILQILCWIKKVRPKGMILLNQFLWHFSTGETNLWWQKSDLWLPGGMRKLSGVLEMFFILTGVMVLQELIFVKTHQTVHLKWAHRISCNLYLLDWRGSEEKENIGSELIGWDGPGEGKQRQVGALAWGDLWPLCIPRQALSLPGASHHGLPNPRTRHTGCTKKCQLWNEVGWPFSFYILCVRNIFSFPYLS